jgi:hypothetical protein
MFLAAKVVDAASFQIECHSFITSGKIASLASPVRFLNGVSSHGLYGMSPSAVLVYDFGSWLDKGWEVASCFGTVQDSHR